MNTIAFGAALCFAPAWIKTQPPILAIADARAFRVLTPGWDSRDMLPQLVRSVMDAADCAAIGRGKGRKASRRLWGVRFGLSKADLRDYEKDMREMERQESAAENAQWGDAPQIFIRPFVNFHD